MSGNQHPVQVSVRGQLEVETTKKYLSVHRGKQNRQDFVNIEDGEIPEYSLSPGTQPDKFCFYLSS